MGTCGLCGSQLTGTSDEGLLILECVAEGRMDKELCARCYAPFKSNWHRGSVLSALSLQFFQINNTAY